MRSKASSIPLPQSSSQWWVQLSRTGTRQSTSVQSKRIVKQIIDGGPMVTHDDVDGPDSTSQHQMEAPQPVCGSSSNDAWYADGSSERSPMVVVRLLQSIKSLLHACRLQR